MNVESIINEIRTGGTTVTIEGTDHTMREAAQRLAHDALEAFAGERLRRALMVAAAIADYAQLDEGDVA